MRLRWPTGLATTPVTAPTRSTTRMRGCCSPPSPRTERIRLGPCVAPIYMREPTYVAQLAATLDELSAGRAEVVFGIGNSRCSSNTASSGAGPSDRAPARGPPRHAHGPRRGLDRFRGRLLQLLGSHYGGRPVQEHLPLKIGAMGGPKSMELAGEIADGLHTACAYSPEALGYAVNIFGWCGARRPKPGWPRSRRLPARGDRPRRRGGPPRGRILAAFYIPSMPPALLERHGIEPCSGCAGQRGLCCGRRSARA